jgi:hypothetical protein
VHEIAFIKRLSLWLLVLPILAELLNSAAVKQLRLDVTLPFSWGLLYLAGVLFITSTVIYSIRCPKIIKDYKGWYEYSEREGSYEKLIPLVIEVARALNKTARQRFFKRQFETQHISPRDDALGTIPEDKWAELTEEPAKLREALLNSTADGKYMKDVYAATREAAQKVRRLSRYTIFVLHAVAAVCIIFVVSQNSASVVEHYFPGLVPPYLSQWR